MKYLAIIISIISVSFMGSTWGTPTGDPMTILSIRTVGEAVYIQVDKVSLCDTSIFWLEGSYPGAKQILSNAMMAFATGKQVQLEVRSELGCTGWGTKIMGLTILK